MSSQDVHRFNYIYQELVNEPDDLVGLFAYSIYKQEKIEYIVKFMEENGGVRPTPEELKEFHRMSMGRCSQYRALAELNLNAVMQEVYTNTISELDIEYNKRLDHRLNELKPSFWKSAVQSAAGSVLFTIFLGFLVLIIIGTRYGLSGIIQEGTKMLTGQ